MQINLCQHTVWHLHLKMEIIRWYTFADTFVQLYAVCGICIFKYSNTSIIMSCIELHRVRRVTQSLTVHSLSWVHKHFKYQQAYTLSTVQYEEGSFWHQLWIRDHKNAYFSVKYMFSIECIVCLGVCGNLMITCMHIACMCGCVIKRRDVVLESTIVVCIPWCQNHVKIT